MSVPFANHVHCHIRPVSVLSKSSLRSADAPILGARLDVQYVVGHYRARPAPYHYALRSCPARGELHRAEVW